MTPANASECKTHVEDKSAVSKMISIEIPRGLYEERFNQMLNRTAQQVQLKGFRPGHAPQAMVKRMYGDRIRSDVVGELVHQAYEGALKEHSLNVIGAPQFNLEQIDIDREPKENLKVTATIEIVPEPKIKDYFGVSFTTTVDEFSEEKLSEALTRLREQSARMEPITDRTVAQAGDLAMADCDGKIGDEPAPGSGKWELFELGSGRAPEIEDALTGMDVNEKKEITFALPKDAGEELSGKEATYTIALHGIYQKVVPDLDDEFAKQTGFGDSVQALTERVRKELKRQIEQANESRKQERLFDAIFEENPFEIPQALIDEEIRVMLFEMKMLDAKKKTSYQLDMAPFRERLGKTAEFRARRAIVISRICEQESATATETEVDQWLTAQAEREGESREKLNELFGYPGSLPRLKNYVSREKMIANLLERAKIEVTEVEDDEDKKEAKPKKAKAKPKAKAKEK